MSVHRLRIGNKVQRTQVPSLLVSANGLHTALASLASLMVVKDARLFCDAMMAGTGSHEAQWQVRSLSRAIQ